MKKKLSLLMFLLCMAILPTKGQNDVTKFLGIPVDGSKSAMIQKLKNKGFKTSPNDESTLTGRFNGQDVNLSIVTEKGKVFRICVCEQNYVSETDVRIQFNNLCTQFMNNKRYISLYTESPLLPDNEDISYNITVNHKRYQATFYQCPDTTTESFKTHVENIIGECVEAHARAEADGKTDDLEEHDPLYRTYEYFCDVAKNKTVWFMIDALANKYRIVLYYDNVLNQANGEDL